MGASIGAHGYGNSQPLTCVYPMNVQFMFQMAVLACTFGLPALSTAQNSAGATPSTDVSTTYPIEQGSPYTDLGTGYAFAPTNRPCVEPRTGHFTVDSTGAQHQHSIRASSSLAEMRQKYGLTAEVSGGYGPFRASASHAMYNEAESTRSFNLLSVEMRVHVYSKRISDPRLTPRAAQALERSPSAFMAMCGTSFVVGIDYGGYFVGNALIEYATSTARETSRSAIEATIPNQPSGRGEFARMVGGVQGLSQRNLSFVVLGNVPGPTANSADVYEQYALRFRNLVSRGPSVYRAHTAPFTPDMVELCSDEELCRQNLLRVSSNRAAIDLLLTEYETARVYLEGYRTALHPSMRRQYPPINAHELARDSTRLRGVAEQLRSMMNCLLSGAGSSCQQFVAAPVRLPPNKLSWLRVGVRNVFTCEPGITTRGERRAVMLRGRWKTWQLDHWRPATYGTAIYFGDRNRPNLIVRPYPGRAVMSPAGPLGEICVRVDDGGNYGNNRHHQTDPLAFTIFDPERETWVPRLPRQ